MEANVNKRQSLTSEAVGIVTVLQLEDVVGRAVGVQCSGALLTAADEAVFSAYDDQRPVNELQHKLLLFTC